MRVLHSAEVAGRAGPGESQSGQLGEQSYVHHLSQSVSGHCQSVGSAGCRREIILTSNTQLVFSLTMNLSVTIITIILAVSVSPSPIPGRFSVLTDLCSRMSRICSLFLRSDFTQILLRVINAKISIPEGKSLYSSELYIELRIRGADGADQLFYFSES